jgi:hypothetical protein
MFTFCFTSAAAAQLRSNDRRNSTRQTTVAVRTVKLGLALLAVLAMSGAALAGGNHSGSNSSGMSSRNSSGNSFSQSNQFKLNTSDSFKVSGNKADSNKPIDLGKLNNKPTDKISKSNNKVIDSLKLTGDKSDKLKLGSNDKMLKDKCKDKCDPCHKFNCCPWWYCWNYPCWYPMYGCDCGYYDVPVVYVREGVDLQLLAVRTIDSGDPSQQLGPALRVWVRNNSAVALNHPFNVLALAARGPQPTADLPQAGVRVDGMGAGETIALDIRLPVEANQPGFPMFHVVVDSHREISEVNENNNGLVINRSEVKPIELTQATNGQVTEAVAND